MLEKRVIVNMVLLNMQEFEKHKTQFFSFVDRIKPDEKTAIIAHANCIDGMTSVVFMVEILKKKYPSLPSPSIHFLHYRTGTLDALKMSFKKESIQKVIILDLNVDYNIFEEFEKFRDNFDVLFVDHHPLHPKLLLNEKVIKTHKDDCTSLILYHFGKGLIDEKKWSWLACVAAVSEFSFKKEENLRFIQKHYPTFNSITREDTDILRIMDKMSSLIIYYARDSLMAYNLLIKNDTEKTEQAHQQVAREIEKKLKDFEKNAESFFDGKLYFYFLESQYDIDSKLSTLLSLRHKEATIIVYLKAEGDLLGVSTRNNAESLIYPMNEMMRAGIKGLEGALGGGHPNASGGSLLRKDMHTFKEQVKEFVKEKLKQK